MNTSTQNHDNDTLDMLDETLDDLADMPSTQPFPAGAHLASVIAKRNSKKPGSYIVEMTFKAVVELGDPNATEPNVGDKSTMFISTKKKDGTANDFGQGQLKLFLKPVGAMLGSSIVSDCLEATKDGLDMIVVVGVKRGTDQYPDDQQTIIKAELAE